MHQSQHGKTIVIDLILSPSTRIVILRAFPAILLSRHAIQKNYTANDLRHVNALPIVCASYLIMFLCTHVRYLISFSLPRNFFTHWPFLSYFFLYICQFLFYFPGCHSYIPLPLSCVFMTRISTIHYIHMSALRYIHTNADTTIVVFS
jgi:hypothetical protein